MPIPSENISLSLAERMRQVTKQPPSIPATPIAPPLRLKCCSVPKSAKTPFERHLLSRYRKIEAFPNANERFVRRSILSAAADGDEQTIVMSNLVTLFFKDQLIEEGYRVTDWNERFITISWAKEEEASLTLNGEVVPAPANRAQEP